MTLGSTEWGAVFRKLSRDHDGTLAGEMAYVLRMVCDVLADEEISDRAKVERLQKFFDTLAIEAIDNGR